MQKALDPGISTWPEKDPQLIASRCHGCAAMTFPAQECCPNCSQLPMVSVPLPRSGTLVSWTTQGFLPGAPYVGGKDPKKFTPFGVGLVQLGDLLRVEGRLTENDPDKLKFGMDVELVMVPLAIDEHGDELITFAFRPL
ncbi:Zn-ribbon domain-containing OB-fold protein [Mycobacteroides salmoniphilum]|uniref:Zn-ribbon domain-containing OB-fold protein n=1 Tax=Mycobacteroides salmoniphilum TaxID=404941 RepID=UPI000991ADBE|nr:OB-fold domain-containing protein [Mycobacteroides salmoniphilum]